MRASERLGRYQLLDLVAQDAGSGDGRDVRGQDVWLWRGYDEVLDRAVAVRIMSADDSRAAWAAGADPRVVSVDLTEVDATADTADGRTVRLVALCVLEAAAGRGSSPPVTLGKDL